MTITLSTFSWPRISRQRPGASLEPYHIRNIARRRMSSTTVLLPEPLTPVTQVSRPRGQAHVDVLEVVLGGAEDFKPAFGGGGLDALARDRDGHVPR